MRLRFQLGLVILGWPQLAVLAETSQVAFDTHMCFESVNCYSFGRFIVKEYPTDGIGSEKLSILPKLTGHESCDFKLLPNEFVIDHARVRNGRFLGAKNDFIFFEDSNMGNNLSYFVVYDIRTKKPYPIL